MTKEEVMGYGSASEELVIGGGYVAKPRAAGRGRACSTATPLHPLEIQAILLEMTRNVLPRESVDAHELHNSLRNRVLDAQMRDSVYEALVELRRPDESRPLESARGLLAGAAVDGIGMAVVIGGGGRQRRRRRRAGISGGGGNIEGESEVWSDEGLRERNQFLRTQQLLFPSGKPPSFLLIFSHFPTLITFLLLISTCMRNQESRDRKRGRGREGRREGGDDSEVDLPLFYYFVALFRDACDLSLSLSLSRVLLFIYCQSWTAAILNRKDAKTAQYKLSLLPP